MRIEILEGEMITIKSEKDCVELRINLEGKIEIERYK